MSSNFIDFLAAVGSILSAIVAIAALYYSYYQFKNSLAYANAQADSQNSVKKYEVKRDYQNTILDWFAETTKILLELRFLLMSGTKEYQEKKTCLLADLSTQIELGRLFFPNIDKHDGFGLEKPKAFQGYRNLTLDFLVFSFNIFLNEDARQFENHLVRLQREFTSIICEILDPKEFLNETERHSGRYFSGNLSYEEFLDKDPNNIDLFFPRRPK
ncbi:hypothetical protein [Hymenobacter baengnokdamensis]|uniref:hypothetical protein n=1 Tax=Hymenobacter baengnokdamensis TaxID=2615203 RepID=UPI00124588B2|nr:hypothetical protein [Hymenobacter baengnokdamensis]